MSKLARKLGISVAALAVAGGAALAQTAPTSITPFEATSLDGVVAIVAAFLGVGALIAIGMAIYRKGRQATNKV